MPFELRNCPACGSVELKFIDDKSFKCMSCANTFKEKEDSVNIETKMLQILNEQEHKLYSNAKKNLWIETHKEYLSNENIKKWCIEVKKYSPDDFFANFYEITTFSTVDSICEYLINYLKNNNFIFADEVVRYLIKTTDSIRLINPIVAILDQANLDNEIYKKYKNELNDLSYKLDEGVFNVDIPRDVFICYSSKDVTIVSDIVNYLEENELSCFFAQRNLRHGKGSEDNYELLLKKAMHNSTCILFISTINSRTLECDALKIEIPYLRDRESHKGRIEYVIDQSEYNKIKIPAKLLLQKYFKGQEFCTDREDLIERILNYSTGFDIEVKEDKTSILEKQLKEQQELLKKVLEAQSKPKEEDKKVEEIKVVEVSKNEEIIEKREETQELKQTIEENKGNKISKKVELKEVVYDSKEFEIKDGTLIKYNGNSRKVVIPSNVTTIGEKAFKDNSYLMYVEISNGITTIESSAFEGCSSLVQIILPKSLKNIKKLAFFNCDKLVEIYNLSNIKLAIFDSTDNFVDKSRHGYISSCAKVIHSTLEEKSILAESNDFVFILCDDKQYLLAYKGNKNRIKLPESFEYNGIKNTNYEIYGNAFENNKHLTYVEISNAVTAIGKEAFKNCRSLVQIILPKSLKNIENSAFDDCEKLVEIYNLSTLKLTIGKWDNGYIAIHTKVIHKALEEKSILVNDNDYIFMVYDNKQYILEYEGNNNILNLPESFEYDGKKYLNYEIYEYAFSNCEDVNEIIIPNSITKINYWSNLRYASLKYNEYDNGLYLGNKENPYLGLIKAKNKDIENCIINEKTRFIFDNAFDSCRKLKEISIPDSIEELGIQVFISCSNLTKVKLPKNLKVINALDFMWCEALTDVKMPNNLKRIENSAFSGCNSLVNIEIPNSVEYVGDNAFNCYTRNEKNLIVKPNLKYNEYDNGLYLGNKDNPYLVFNEVKTNKIEKIKIHKDCKIICSNNFIEFKYLRELELPEGLLQIGNKVFNYTKITNVILPKTLKEIGSEAFHYNSMLKTITIPKSIKHIKYNAFADCRLLNPINYEGSEEDWNKIITPNDTYNKKKLVFNYKEENIIELKNEEIISDKEVNEITEQVIKSSNNEINLNKVDSSKILVIDGNHKIIKEDEYDLIGDLSEIEEVIIQEGVEEIDDFAFTGSDNLKKVSISSTVSRISSSAFFNCPFIEIIIVDKKNKTYDSRNDCNAIIETETDTLIIGCKKTIIPNNIKLIGDCAFEECTQLKNIEIPNSVIDIGYASFTNCKSLDSITISNNVTSIGNRAFSGCSSIKNIKLPDSVKEIGSFAFEKCEKLTNITMGNNVENIGESSFIGCKSLINFKIPNSLKVIERELFSGCSSLISVLIPYGVKTIESAAFKDCSSLKEIYIPNSVFSIENNAFELCSNTIIRFEHKKPLIGYPKGYDKEMLGKKGKPKQVLWDQKR